jgi:hypothetical protein
MHDTRLCFSLVGDWNVVRVVVLLPKNLLLGRVLGWSDFIFAVCSYCFLGI